MKESKAVYVTKRDLKLNLLQREYQYQYQTYLNRVLDIDVGNGRRGEVPSRDVGVQCSSKKDNRICTCKNVTVLKRHPEAGYFSSSPKQIYTYHRTRSYTDIGVGSVIALQKKKVKKIYLPETEERGAGSSDLSAFSRRSRYCAETSYYEHKRTSSKCVGVYIENTSEGVVSAKVSPIIQTKSGTTSPKEHIPIKRQNNEIGNNTIVKQFVTITTQIDTEDIIRDKELDPKTIEVLMPKPIIKNISKQLTKENKEIKEIKAPLVKTANQSTKKSKIKVDKSFSSDSLVQHVHNLENPSEVKSIDMENKLEREYRKMFATTSKITKEESNIDKPAPDFKSASLLRRRFDALRRTLGKKEDSKKNCVIINKSSIESFPSHKDASVTSDPPSLEGRSYSNMKTYRYNPYTSIINEHNDEEAVPLSKKSYTGRKENDSSSQFSRSNTIDSEYAQGVKGMFKLWGKKFNLDEEENKDITPMPSYDAPKKTETPTALETTPTKPATDEKKEMKKFFFFKKKNKDAKPKKTFDNNKKGVTAGRCEVRDGLMVKIGGGTTQYSSIAPAKVKTEKTSTRNQTPEGKIESYEILRNAWLMKYLTMPIESRASVNVRWNNKTYATSSSTIFELMENVYKETGVVFRSKSEIITDESSYYKSYTKQNLNFVQNIQAWMIPKTIPDQPIPIGIERNCAGNKSDKSKDDDMQLSTFDQKNKMNKSKAFAQKIEVVLHSNNTAKLHKSACDSECLKIDIPRGFFSDSSSEQPQVNQTSDEEVYKIVEYETFKSSSDIKNVKKHYLDLSETSTNMKVTINITKDQNVGLENLNRVLKESSMPRDIVIQDSKVFISKKYDVVGVGIITQRDTKEVRKPIVKLLEYITDEESDRSIRIPQKKCEFAESYLQDYYRNYTPMGFDLYSWYFSDSHLKCCSDNPSLSSLNNGDGSKSCPNVYDNYLASAIVSSCATSSCSQCCPVEDKSLAQQNKKNKKNKKSKSELEDPLSRVLPKDSLEVFKSRKIYASSNKSNWNCTEDELPSAPCFDGDSRDCSKPKPCFKTVGAKSANVKQCKKRVSLQECEVLKPKTSISGILAFKGSAGCDICKKDMVCPKHAKVSEESICSIPDPTCRESCLESIKPQCAQPKSNPCLPPSSPPRHPKTCRVNKKPRTCPPEPCPPVPCPSSPPYCKSSPCSTPPKCSPKPSISPLPPCPPIPTCPPKQTCPQRCPEIPSPPKPICSPLPPCKPKITCPPEPCPPQPCLSQPCPPQPCPPQPCPPQPRSPKPCPLQPSPPPPCPQQPPQPKPSILQPCPPKPWQPQPSPPQPCPAKPCPSQSCPPPLCPPKTCPAQPCPPKLQLSSTSCSPVSSGIKLTRLPCPNSPKCPSPPKKTKPKQSVYCDMSPCREQKPCPRVPCIDGCTTPRRPVTPPCDGCKPSKKPSCDEFPWPTKNQISPSSSRLSVCCPKSNSATQCSSPTPKKKDKCAKNCMLKPSPPPCPHAPPPTLASIPCPASAPRKQCHHKQAKSAKSKISGLFLRQKPKKCSDDCLAWEKEQGQRNILRLNSHERITINMKEKTPSTEEIREMMGIKVQDEDGQTLYERADYGGGQDSNMIRNWCKKRACEHESSYLCNICKDSNVNVHKVGSARSRVSKSKSDPSIANLVEIVFKLRVTQGDKTTEINIENDGDSDKKKNEKEKNERQTSQEVFVLKNDEVEPSLEENNPRNDINIRILIKNYKDKSDKKKHTEKYKKHGMVDDFSRKISEKFQTVSTGYSSDFNEIHQDDSHVFSVHRATIDLTSSNDKSQNQFKKSEEKITEQQLHENYENNKESTTKNPVTEMPLIERYVVEQPVVDKPIKDQLVVDKPEENLNLIETYVVEKSLVELISEDKPQIGQAEIKKDIDIEVTTYASSKGEAKKYTEKSVISTEPVKKWYDKQSDTHFSLTTDTDDQDYSLGMHIRTSESERHTDLGNKTSDDPDTDILVKTSDEPIINADKTYKDKPALELVHRSRFSEKKAMLKEVFENANYLTKPKTKSRITKLKNMIKAILTSDSSEPGDSLVVVTSNALAKDLTYASLRPTIFKNSNSLNNFYIGESAFGSDKYSSDERPQFPTEENSPKESDEWSDKVTNKGCLCSKLAAGLEKCNKNVSGGCCCRKVYKYDQETICDLRNNEDELLSCRSAEYVDVETQNSLYFDSKTNSTNVSVNDKLHTATGENPPDILTQLHSKTKSSAEISNFEEHEHIKTKISKHTHIPQQNTAQVNSKIKPEIFVDNLIQSVFKSQTADKSSSGKLAQLKSNTEPKVGKKDNEKQLDQVNIDYSPGKLLHMRNKTKSLSIEIVLDNLIERVHNKSQLPNKEIPPEILIPLKFNETNQHYEQGLKNQTNQKTSIKKIFSPHAKHTNECELKKLDRNTKLGISEDDKIVFLESESTKTISIGNSKKYKEKMYDIYKHRHKHARFKHSDILQMYETKKAVLQIYAEKKEAEDGGHLVAKLPKFVYDIETELFRNYEELTSNSFKTMCKRNLVTMSVRR